MGYDGLARVAIIFYIFVIIFIGMLFVGLKFIVCGVVKYFKNGKNFTSEMKKTVTIGISLAALPLLSLTMVGINKINETVNNSRDLYYQATLGTVEGMRRILDSGVPADCEAFSGELNVAAEGTETTILGYLVIYYNDSRNEHQQYGEKIQLLIDYGADVNREMGHISMPDVILTPLLMAVDCKNGEIAELLLKNGADVNARYQDGRTALEKISSEIDSFRSDGSQHDENFYNNLLSVREVLLKYGAE